MNKILAVDLDEVLAETVDEVLKSNNYMIKWQAIYRDDISDYYVSNIPKYNLVKDEAIDFFWSVLWTPARENILPVKWAREKLKEFRGKWWKIVVVTARVEKISEYTHKRLDRYYNWIIDDVLFANHYSDKEVPKSVLCKNIWAKIMIEDNLDFAMELAQFGIKVYLLDKPWNRNYSPVTHKWITKVYDWSEINL